MFYSLKNYIKRLQRLSENQKKIRLIIASGVTITIVIVMWVVYLNATLPQMAKLPSDASSTAPTAASDQNSSSTVSSEDGFFSTLGRGFSEIGKDLSAKIGSFTETMSNGFSSLRGQLNKKNEFNFEPNSNP